MIYLANGFEVIGRYFDIAADAVVIHLDDAGQLDNCVIRRIAVDRVHTGQLVGRADFLRTALAPKLERALMPVTLTTLPSWVLPCISEAKVFIAS